VSLVSFDKKEMMMYITYYKAKYFSYSDIFSELISFNGKNMYHNNHLYCPFSGVTRIRDNIWNYVYFSKYAPKYYYQIYSGIEN
jgi:hypothetical protein